MEWISVDDNVPQIVTSVLIYAPDREIPFTGYFYENKWWEINSKVKHKVTHWMPLPEPPKQ